MRFVKSFVSAGLICLASIQSTDASGDKPKSCIAGLIRRSVACLVPLTRGSGNGPNPISSTPDLIPAVTLGGIEEVRHLIKSNVNLNESDRFGSSALLHAIIFRDEAIADLLIRSGANVNLVNDEGRSPLQIASKKGLFDLSKLLIDNGANVNQIDVDGSSALILAAANGHIKVVELLIAHGAEIDQLDNGGRSALLFAAVQGHVDVVDFLIAHGAKVDHLSNSGISALLIAAQSGKSNVVDLLILNGADVNLGSPIRDAVLSSRLNLALIKSLILAGADPNVIDHAHWEQYVEPIMRPVTLIQEFARSGTSPIGQEVSGISTIQSMIAFAFEAKKSGRDIFAEADVLQFLHVQQWTMSKIEMIKSITHQLVLLKCTDLSVIYIVAPFLISSDDDAIKRFEIGLKFLTNSIKDLMSTTGSVHRQSLVEYTGPILNGMIHRASPLGLRPVVKALYTIYWETFKGQLSLRGLRIPEGLNTIIHSFDKGPLGIYTDLESRAMSTLGEEIKKRH